MKKIQFFRSKMNLCLFSFGDIMVETDSINFHWN